MRIIVVLLMVLAPLSGCISEAQDASDPILIDQRSGADAWRDEPGPNGDREALRVGASGPWTTSFHVSHGHARLTSSHPLQNGTLELSPVNGDWVRPMYWGSGNDTLIIGFLEPGISYRLSGSVQSVTGEVHTVDRVFRTQEKEITPQSEESIHPGMLIRLPDTSCTLAFIVRSPVNDTLHALTAGHCVLDEVRDDVFVPQNDYPVYWEDNGTQFGSVEVARFGSSDWALISIDPAYQDQVSVDMPRWGGPQGLAYGEHEVGDVLCFYGAGLGFREVEPSRGRCTTYRTYQSDHIHAAPGTGINGDSGSPVVHAETGAAVGVLVGGIYGAHLGINPICVILQDLADSGYPVRLLWGNPTTTTGELPGYSDGLPPPVDFLSPELHIPCRDDIVALHAEVS